LHKKKYCKGCIERHYNESFSDIEQEKWICLFCRNLCVCAFCRRKRGEAVPKKILTKRKRSNSKKEEFESLSPPRKRKKNDKNPKVESPLSPNAEKISPQSSPQNGTPIPSPTDPLETTKTQEECEILEEASDDEPCEVKIEENDQPNMIQVIETCLIDLKEYSNHKQAIEQDKAIISHLIHEDLIKFGDKLVLINSHIFVGEIVSTGSIELEWKKQTVANLPQFTEACGIQYGEKCWDIIWCNGYKLRHYIDAFFKRRVLCMINNSYHIEQNTFDDMMLKYDNYQLNYDVEPIQTSCSSVVFHDVHENFEDRMDDVAFGDDFGGVDLDSLMNTLPLWESNHGEFFGDHFSILSYSN